MWHDARVAALLLQAVQCLGGTVLPGSPHTQSFSTASGFSWRAVVGTHFGGGFAGVRDCIPCGACLAHLWSVGGSHIAHRAVFSLVYRLPLGHGRAVAFGSGVVNQVLGGWSLETIVGARTGLPSRRIGAMPVRFARLRLAFAPT